jgi:uncharacterized RDD family membrane protein YckC
MTDFIEDREMQDLAQTNPATIPSPPPGTAYASFSRRALAFSVDQVILWGVILVLIIPATILIGLGTIIAWPFVFIILAPPFLPVTTVIAWIYFAAQESSRHQGTFGKRLCGLRVTDLQGNPISFARATVRFFGKFLSSAIMMIGWIMAAFTERHQALHDIIAETVVLRKVKSKYDD